MIQQNKKQAYNRTSLSKVELSYFRLPSPSSSPSSHKLLRLEDPERRRMKNNISMGKYYSYEIEINLLNVIMNHKFRLRKNIPNSFVFSDHQSGVGCSREYILCHIGNDNIFSVRFEFSFEINYNFSFAVFPMAFLHTHTHRTVADRIKKCCTTGLLFSSSPSFHTQCSAAFCLHRCHC